MTTHRIASNWISRPPGRPFLVGVVIALLLLLSMTARPAAAHGYLIRAIPADRTALERSPTRVQFWFSEDLEPQFSTVTVRDQAGQVVAQGGVDPDDRTLLEARLPSGLPEGAYVSELRLAFASDGHVIVETRVFFVGEAVGGLAGSTGDGGAVPLEVVWRALLLASTLTLFGAFALYSLVLAPAWGSADYRAGRLPPRVMSRLDVIVFAALGVALAANLLALLQQSMVFFGADLGRVLGEGLWNVVRIGTRFGDTWNVRTLPIVVIALIHGARVWVRKTQPELVRPGYSANVWSAALLLGTWSVASHAVGSQVLPWVALFSDWLHGLAVGLWAGGLVALTFVLPVALAPYCGDDRRLALLAALRRFSRVAMIGLVLVVATGVYNALNWFATPSDVASPYGTSLLLKLALAAVLAGIGAAHHAALRPERYERWRALWNRAGRFLPTLRLESVVAIGVIALAAWLSATPPPAQQFESPPPPGGEITLDGVPLRVTVTPGGTGVNTYDVQPLAELSADEGETLYVRLANPDRDVRGSWHEAEAVDGGLFTAAGADVDGTGRWWVLVARGDSQAVLPIEVTADAELLRTREPSLLHLVALAGVIGAGLFALSSPLGRLYRRLDLSPQAVTAAVGAILAGVVISVVGLIAAANSYAEQELLLNPPPTIVNSQPPDAESLASGRVAFETQCAGWGGTRDFDELIERLPRTRDEAVYHAVVDEGWWDLPPCAATLDEVARWDLVNYIRSLEPKG
ncbi:MAG: CopD family protein [Chloroflexi bacterium]|nr:CopD family protein [Chloroflexota bacterium]